MKLDLITWLREECARYSFDVVATYRRRGDHDWPLVAKDADDLVDQLAAGGHFLPLPKEPAALANVLEVSIVDYLLERAEAVEGLEARRGSERGYPDLEFTGPALGDEFWAVDVKVAKRARSGRQTQSRITLYTGNTYFRFPQLHWPGTFRPFQDYAEHLDVICIYTLDEDSTHRLTDPELIVHEAWRIGSTKRSSTTREYLGAVQNIADLRAGRGEFVSAADFYKYWRDFKFKITDAVEKQLKKLLSGGNP